MSAMCKQFFYPLLCVNNCQTFSDLHNKIMSKFLPPLQNNILYSISTFLKKTFLPYFVDIINGRPLWGRGLRKYSLITVIAIPIPTAHSAMLWKRPNESGP